MNTALILGLLQTAAAMLTGVQQNHAVASSTAQQAVQAANLAVQEAVQLQAMPKIAFPIPKNNSIWPNITDLYDTAYLDANGNYQPNGTNAALDAEDTSFGDLNGNGFDDAAVIVKQITGPGQSRFDLAAMLNQNGIMFDVADLPLGDNVQVFSHRVIQGGEIVLGMQIGNQPPATMTYQLIGDQIFRVQ